LGNNFNSNNFLEVLIAGVKLTPRVKDVSKFEGNRRVEGGDSIYRLSVKETTKRRRIPLPGWTEAGYVMCIE